MNIFQKGWYTLKLGISQFFFKHGYKKAAVSVMKPGTDFNEVFTEGKKDVVNTVDHFGTGVKSVVNFISGTFIKTLVILGVVAILVLVFYKRIEKVIA